MPHTGRPRSLQADRAVIDAALDLLAEQGYDGLTMEGVAARAGVAKTTVYRRWGSRADLLLELARHIAAPVRVVASGDLRRDLLAVASEIVAVLTAPLPRRVLPRALADARDNEELAEVLATFWAERRDMLVRLLRRAVDEGQLRAELDLDVAADALYGPIYYRYLVSGAPLDRRTLAAVVDQALDGMRAG